MLETHVGDLANDNLDRPLCHLDEGRLVAARPGVLV
jgi:hypothetical protein